MPRRQKRGEKARGGRFEVSRPIAGLNLYVGSLAAANDLATLTSLGVTAVVNVGAGKCPFRQRFAYHRVSVEDSTSASILPFLGPAADFIHEALVEGGGGGDGGGTVLVHCRAGVSRSPTVAAAYLVRYAGLDAPEALRAVRRARPNARPNPTFAAELKTFAEALDAARRGGPVEEAGAAAAPQAPQPVRGPEPDAAGRDGGAEGAPGAGVEEGGTAAPQPARGPEP